MDSINARQEEKNREDLSGVEAVEKIRELVSKTDTCFFCTAQPVGGSVGARPMAVQEVDDSGHLWFLSAVDSHKNAELGMRSSVTLYFQGSAHSDFLVLYGRARVSQDERKIEKLWEPVMKTWFTEGKEDARITVIEVVPSEGYYWDTKHGNFVSGVKILIGAATGKTLDDSIEGKLAV